MNDLLIKIYDPPVGLLCHFGVVEDGGKDVVEFVGHAAGHSPDAAQPLSAEQLVSEPGNFFLVGRISAFRGEAHGRAGLRITGGVPAGRLCRQGDGGLESLMESVSVMRAFSFTRTGGNGKGPNSRWGNGRYFPFFSNFGLGLVAG